MAPDAWDDAPMSSTGVLRVQQVVGQNKLPPVAEILADATGNLDFYQRYATRAAFFRYLYELDRQRAIRMVAETRRLGGGAGFMDRIAAVVVKQFGKQLNLLLDRSDDGFLCLAMSAGFGLTLFEYSSRQYRWSRIFARKHAAVVVGKPFAVRVKVADKAVEVRIGTEVVGTAQFPGRAMDGAYGLGALSGSAGIWTAVQLDSRTK